MKSRKTRKKKLRQKENKAKTSVKKNCQGNFEMKRFIESFKSRNKILKLKKKIKNIK